MKRFFLIFLFFSLFFLHLPSPAHAIQNTPRMVYTGPLFQNYSQPDPDKLNKLYQAGIGTLFFHNDYADGHLGYASPEIKFIRENPVLSKFTYLYAFIAPTKYYFKQCQENPKCDLQTFVPTGFLDIVINLVKNNSDLFVGYYPFDEPAYQQISKKYQENVYNYLRSKDPDSINRPVVIAHSAYNPKSPTDPLSDLEIQRYMSPNAQDIIFIDQYTTDLELQKKYFKALSRNNLLKKPFWGIVRAFWADDKCRNPEVEIFLKHKEEAAKAVDAYQNFQNFGYFAFWPNSKPDFKVDMENCSIIFDSVIQQLKNHNTLQPTAKPTVKPTAKPTVKPTAKPTVKPTAIPTTKPTTLCFLCSSGRPLKSQGNANCDSKIDLSDFSAWQSTYQQLKTSSSPPDLGLMTALDFTCTSSSKTISLDLEDYLAWYKNYLN